MKQNIVKLLMLILLITIVSCRTLPTRKMKFANDLIKLKIGMEEKYLDSIHEFPNSFLNHYFNFTFENDKYSCQTTQILNYEYSKKETKTRAPNRSYATEYERNNYHQRTYSSTGQSLDYFCLIYKNGKLEYYGYVYEFLYSSSEKLNKLGLILKKRLIFELETY